MDYLSLTEFRSIALCSRGLHVAFLYHVIATKILIWLAARKVRFSREIILIPRNTTLATRALIARRMFKQRVKMELPIPTYAEYYNVVKSCFILQRFFQSIAMKKWLERGNVSWITRERQSVRSIYKFKQPIPVINEKIYTWYNKIIFLNPCIWIFIIIGFLIDGFEEGSGKRIIVEFICLPVKIIKDVANIWWNGTGWFQKLLALMTFILFAIAWTAKGLTSFHAGFCTFLTGSLAFSVS